MYFMSLSFNQKKTVVREVTQAISSARAGVLAEYRGMTVAQLTSLRTEARNYGVWIKVIKNNLAKRVISGSDFKCLTQYFVGPVIFLASQDPIAVAKVVSKFVKDNDHLKITVGAMNGSLIDQSVIEKLSKLPNRDELLAKLAYIMIALVHKLALTINEVPSKFVRTLYVVAEKKEQFR